MDVSLGALRERLLNFRAWDSTGTTFNKRVREAVNVALERLAGDVPEALIPDEEHVVVYTDVKGGSTDVTATLTARLKVVSSDAWVLQFTDSAGNDFASGPLWTPTIDGTWDGIMHLEIKDPDGTWHRRQSRNWWSEVRVENQYYVSLDRPWKNASDTLMDFRIHQPEFFVRDDVMRVLEPARIWDETRRQIWAIDTGGAQRQDMIDFRGESSGRPYRMWRGRHFQVPAPTAAPTTTDTSQSSASKEEILSTASTAVSTWAGPEFKGSFRFCYTYVWGYRDDEWQDSPGNNRDPMWESAPSPEVSYETTGATNTSSIQIRATDIMAMQKFNVSGTAREGRSGFRIRFYVARDSVEVGSPGEYDNVETDGRYYMLAEINPADTSPTAVYTWDGSVIPDYYRPLMHSTGYYAYKLYPHPDARYELDLRVLRLPRKFLDDQDTAPIQRDAISTLIELSLYYLSLMDGVDQGSAQEHLRRYQQLAQRYRLKYANPGKAVEAVPIGGTRPYGRFGTFANE